MIDLRRWGYDSDRDVVKCEACKKEIAWNDDKVLIGTGNSLATAYHKHCWHELLDTVPPQCERTGEEETY